MFSPVKKLFLRQKWTQLNFPRFSCTAFDSSQSGTLFSQKNGLYLPKCHQDRFKIAQIVENRVSDGLESNVVHENLGKIQLSAFPA